MTNVRTPFDLYRAGDLTSAEREARAALASRGDDVGLRHLLGVLLCRRGELDKGAAELAGALELAPGHVGIRAMLVRALIDLGRGEEALAYARRPAPGPAAAELWRVRAEAAEAAGAFSEYIDALRHAALETVTAKLADHPDEIESLLDQARLLIVLRRTDEGEQAYRAILARHPDHVEAVREVGLLFERTNRLDLLGALIADADRAAIAPERIAYLHALAAWREQRPEEALEWLSKASRDEDPVRVAQLEARLHDALDNPAAAFRSAEAKNQVVADRAAWRAEAARHRATLRTFADRITPEWIASWSATVGGSRRPPAFLVGFPRSGTTLLDTFLMGHPEVAVIEEVPSFDKVAAELGGFDRLATLGSEEIDHLRQIYFDAMDRHVPAGFGGLVIDKMPLNMLCAPLIHRLFPDCRFVFAQRHPCDCVLSGYLQNFELNASMACFLDLEDAADFYDIALDIWTRSEGALPLRVRRLVYEEMIEDPGASLRKVIGFLGLEWREELLDHRSTAIKRGAITTPSYDQVTEPLSTQPIGRWRRYERQLEPVLPVLLPWARRLGYTN